MANEKYPAYRRKNVSSPNCPTFYPIMLIRDFLTSITIFVCKLIASQLRALFFITPLMPLVSHRRQWEQLKNKPHWTCALKIALSGVMGHSCAAEYCFQSAPALVSSWWQWEYPKMFKRGVISLNTLWVIGPKSYLVIGAWRMYICPFESLEAQKWIRHTRDLMHKSHM
jgi:hypothetical protein